MAQENLSPVSLNAPGGDSPALGIGLCLSGGGYRAMLFHLGVLWRLAELGYLGTRERTGKHGPIGTLQRVSSVSDGGVYFSIRSDIAGYEDGLPPPVDFPYPAEGV